MEAGEEGCVLGTGPYLRQELSTGPGFPQQPCSTSVLCTQNTVGRFYQFYMYI